MNTQQRDSIANEQTPYTRLHDAAEAVISLGNLCSPFGAVGMREWVATVKGAKLLDGLDENDTALVAAAAIFGYDCGPGWLASHLARQFDEDVRKVLHNDWRVYERIARALALLTEPFGALAAEGKLPAGW